MENEDKAGWGETLPQTLPPGATKENVTRLVDRLIPKDPTFFDHLRLKNLGASLVDETAPRAKGAPTPAPAKGNGNGAEAAAKAVSGTAAGSA
ncbi:MAG: hypothetical protein LBJ61_03015, partial [Deltaproteobacteria bacterium]|nr:hypothetical protein [Deltaproteobacteria bacterium]